MYLQQLRYRFDRHPEVPLKGPRSSRTVFELALLQGDSVGELLDI